MLLILLNGNSIFSQQSTLFNSYSLDPFQLNIAYAGSLCKEINLHTRTQWIGMPNAPKALQITGHNAFGKSNGIGFRINSQSIGLLDKLSFTLGYSYKIKIGKYSDVHFGLGIGWDQTQFNSNKAIVLSNKDVNLNNLNQQKANGTDFEFGAVIISKKSRFGFSILHLYNSNPDFSGNSSIRTLPQINLMGSYIFDINKKVEIEPSLLNRFTLKGDNVLEGIINVNLLNSITIGAGYRNNYGLIFLTSYKIKNLRFAYSIDYGTNKNAITLGSSHQIMIGYRMCKTESKLGFNIKFRKLFGYKKSQKEKVFESDSLDKAITQTETNSKTDSLVTLNNQNEDALSIKNQENNNVVPKDEILPDINNKIEKYKTDSNLISKDISIIKQKEETKKLDSTLMIPSNKKSDNNIKLVEKDTLLEKFNILNPIVKIDSESKLQYEINSKTKQDSLAIKTSVLEPEIIKKVTANEPQKQIASQINDISDKVISKTEKDSLPTKIGVSDPEIFKDTLQNEKQIASQITDISDKDISKTEKDSLPTKISVSDPEIFKDTLQNEKQIASQITDISDKDISKTEKDSMPTKLDIKNQEIFKETLRYEKEKKIVAKINSICEEVIFKLNAVKLNKEMLKKLDIIANVIKADPELKINIIGHTCNRGTKEFNDILSQQRAEYVKRELFNRGIKKENFNETKGVGFNNSLFDNSTQNQEKNRTIRFNLVR